MNRQIININENWKFHYGECEEAFYKGWDDSNFKDVTLPHDWSVEYPFERTNSSGTGYLNGGIGWYRLHFNLPEEYRNRHITLCFDGIYKNSQVWINSYNLGKHPYGYTPFYLDISEFANFGETENVIAVKVTHTDLADSRWFTGSGITRKAYLRVEENVHPAADGIYVITDSAESGTVSFSIHHEITNDSKIFSDVSVNYAIFDNSGALKWTSDSDIVIAPGETLTVEKEGALASAVLWNIENPYLYTLRTTYTVAGENYIADEQKVGFRTALFDAEKGFFLNGKNVKFKGVCVHHDAGVLGAAVTREVWKRRLEKLKECGCNAIRCSHNPHMPELYDLCDEMGFLMMDEAFDEWECPKNKWSTGHNVYPPKHQGYAEDFPEWHERDLRLMVRRDRIHPSVVMWSIGNEIDYPNDPYCHPSFETMTGNNDANKPSAERVYDSNKPNAERMVVIAGELSRIVKLEDESRPVTMALAFPELSARLGIFDALDVAGYNYKEHLYERDHSDFPDTPILGSENGHGYNAWQYVARNDYMSGQFLWTGIDYLGEAHGWPIHGAGAGLINLAGFEKHRFMARKSYWCDEPVLEMATRIYEDPDSEWTPCYQNWNYDDGQKILVKCFTNLSEIALCLNGLEIARQKGYNLEGVYGFEVPFEKGELTAVAYNENGNEVKRTSLVTAGKAASFDVNVWEDSGEKTSGYLYQIELKLKDAFDNPVTWDNHKVTVRVSGDGKLKGIENGDLADNTSYSCDFRMTFDGKALIYVQRTGNGSINAKIVVEGINDGLKELTIGKTK